MLYAMLAIAINAFVSVEACSFVVIYERKVCASRVIYLRSNVMSSQLLYY